MRPGEEAALPKLSRARAVWCDNVARRKVEYARVNGEQPDGMTMTQDDYLALCASVGQVVKNIHGLQIIVAWGRSLCLNK